MTQRANLDQLLACLSALSVATERAVTVVKTLVPWLAAVKPFSDSKLWPKKEELRRLSVMAIGFVLSLSLYRYVILDPAVDRDTWHLTIGDRPYNIFLLAFISLGGSALWSHLIGVLTALKDARRADVDQATQGETAGMQMKTGIPRNRLNTHLD